MYYAGLVNQDLTKKSQKFNLQMGDLKSNERFSAKVTHLNIDQIDVLIPISSDVVFTNTAYCNQKNDPFQHGIYSVPNSTSQPFGCNSY